MRTKLHLHNTREFSSRTRCTKEFHSCSASNTTEYLREKISFSSARNIEKYFCGLSLSRRIDKSSSNEL